MEEQTMRTILLAAIGFTVLLVDVPAWARVEVAVFGVLFAALAYALDESIKDVVRRMLDSGLRRNDGLGRNDGRSGNDATKASAKSPASRPAAF
jgi:hypothetical protein